MGVVEGLVVLGGVRVGRLDVRGGRYEALFDRRRHGDGLGGGAGLKHGRHRARAAVVLGARSRVVRVNGVGVGERVYLARLDVLDDDRCARRPRLGDGLRNTLLRVVLDVAAEGRHHRHTWYCGGFLVHPGGDQCAAAAALVRDRAGLAGEFLVVRELEPGETRRSRPGLLATDEADDVSRDGAVGIDPLTHGLRLHPGDLLGVHEVPRLRRDVLRDVDPRGLADELRRELRLIEPEDGREDRGRADRSLRRDLVVVRALPGRELLLVHADVVSVDRLGEHHAVAVDDVGARGRHLLGDEPLCERLLGQPCRFDALDHHETAREDQQEEDRDERDGALPHHGVADAHLRR